jgi:hypothetical protein
MTNLQGPSKGVKLPISPEQALVVLPALGGVVLAAVVAGAGLVPLHGQLTAQEERLRTFRDQEQQLPLLRRQQSTLLDQLKRAEQQEERVMQLVSDVEQLDTLLTALNRLAAATGVVIMTVEPEKSAPSPATPAAGQPVGQPAEAKPKQDERFSKRSYLMILEASYGGLLEFLRRAEALNTAVLVSDLEVAGGKSTGVVDAQQGSAQVAKLNVKLRLTAYQRVLEKKEKEKVGDPRVEEGASEGLPPALPN